MMRAMSLFALAMLSAASPAFAHAMLERASPLVGSEVPAPPHEITLTFTEGVEPLFSTIEVRDAHGATLATGKARTDTGEQSKACRRIAGAWQRHLYGDLARNLGRHAQDRRELPVHREIAHGQPGDRRGSAARRAPRRAAFAVRHTAVPRGRGCRPRPRRTLWKQPARGFSWCASHATVRHARCLPERRG